MSKSFRRKVDAERWLRDEIGNLERGLWVDPTHGRIAWADYSAQLLAGRIHLAARTIETDRRCHERAAEWIGDVQLNRLTPELVRKLMSELSASGYAPETVAKTMRWVRLTLNQAVRDRRIAVSPAEGIRLSKARRSEMRLLDANAVNELAAALPDRYRSIAIVAAYTGLRVGRAGCSPCFRYRYAAGTPHSALCAGRGVRAASDARRPEVAGLRADYHPPRCRRRYAGSPPP